MILRPYQIEAVEFLMARRRAFLVAPAGSGKSFCGASALAKVRPGKYAWVANTKEQVEQAETALAGVGLEGGLVCCMMARPDLSSYDHVVIDECFPAGTLVDGTPIEKLAVGDSVSCFDHQRQEIASRPVVHVFKRKASNGWVRLEWEGGSLICTENHPIFVCGVGYLAARDAVNYYNEARGKSDPDAGVQCMQKTVCAAVHVPSTLSDGRENEGLLLEGVSSVRGTPDTRTTRRVDAPHKRSQTTNAHDVLLRVRQTGGVSRLVSPATSDAGSKGAASVFGCVSGGSPDTREGGKPREVPFKKRRDVKEADIARGHQMRAVRQAGGVPKPTTPLSRCAGAESRVLQPGVPVASGNLTEAARANITNLEGPHVFGTRGKRGAYKAPIVAREEGRTSDRSGNIYCPGQGEVSESSDMLQGGSRGRDGEAGCRGRRAEPHHAAMEILRQAEDGSVERVGLDSAEIYERGSANRPGWVPREDTVYNLEVEEFSNYFADGILVHNCHHAPAAVWGSVIGTVCSEATLWGLSATPFGDDDARNDFLKRRFEEFMFIEREEVMAGGHLVPGIVRPIDIDKPFEYDADMRVELESEIKRWKARYRFLPEHEIRKRVQWQLTLKHLQDNPARNAAVVNLARAEILRGETVIVLVASIEHGQQLADQIEGALVVHSKLPAKERRKRVDDLRSGALKCAVATSLLDEGADIPKSSVLILAAGGRSATKTVQRAGRVMRPHKGKTAGVVYDFVDRGLAHANAQWKARRRTYLDLGYTLEEAIGI